MQLGSPTSLLWLLLAIPIAICYFLKVRPRRVSVPSVILWEEVFDQRRPRAIWRRLRHIVSLLLQLLFLLLVGLALANPLFSWQLERTRTIVVIVDNSASMSATDVPPSRLETAKSRANELINGLREQENMAIISAVQPRVEIGLNDHPRLLSRSVDQIRATDAPAHLEDAMALARRLVEGKDNGQIILFTDQMPSNVASSNSDNVPTQIVTIGSKADNVAITQFHVRRNLDDRLAFQVLIAVNNFGDSPADVELEIALGDQLLDVLPLRLEPDQPWQSVLEYTSADGGTITATIDHADALACDNQAFAQLIPRLPQPVILVSPGDFFLENVLASVPQVVIDRRAEVPTTIPDGAILVVHRTALDQFPEGNVFCIDPTTDSEVWSLGAGISNPVISRTDESSPLMSHLQLENMLLPGARELTISEPHQVLVQTVDGSSVYTALSRSMSRVLVLSTNLQLGDLPLRTAFPILMNNAVSWFQGEGGELQPSISTGQVTQMSNLPGMQQSDSKSAVSVQPLKLVAPDGRRRSLTPANGAVTVGPLDQCGIWQLKTVDTSPGDESNIELRRLACNLANARESDVRVQPRSDALIRTGAWMSRPAWIYLVLLSLALIGTEWFLYQRRWIS